MKRVAIYTRVSTPKRRGQSHAWEFEQDPAVQEAPLRTMEDQRGWKLAKVYTDRASGASDARPGLAALMRDARRGLFDIVLVWRFDRFARSVRQLVNALAEFQILGIDFISHQEALDTSTQEEARQAWASPQPAQNIVSMMCCGSLDNPGVPWVTGARRGRSSRFLQGLPTFDPEGRGEPIWPTQSRLLR